MNGLGIDRRVPPRVEHEDVVGLMREEPVLLIGEGTSEIQETIISRGLLKNYQLIG